LVFWLFVILAAVLLWFLLSPTYKILGEFFGGLFENAKKEMTDEENERKDQSDEQG